MSEPNSTEKAVSRGNIKQSIVYWCFNSGAEKWDVETTCRAAQALGCESVEVVAPEDWGILKKYGLVCALAPNGISGLPFVRGYNNPKYHAEVIAAGKKMIDACADAGFPNVIGFTGNKWRNAEDPKS